MAKGDHRINFFYADAMVPPQQTLPTHGQQNQPMQWVHHRMPTQQMQVNPNSNHPFVQGQWQSMQ